MPARPNPIGIGLNRGGKLRHASSDFSRVKIAVLTPKITPTSLLAQDAVWLLNIGSEKNLWKMTF